MICFDNIVFCLQRSGGVSRFWSKLLQGGGSTELADYRFVEPPGACGNIYRQGMDLKGVIADRPLPTFALRYLDFGERFGLKRKYQCSVFHSSYYRLCRERGVANVTTVHDLIYEKFAKGPARWAHLLQKRRALRGSDCIVCVSENTKRDLLEYYPEVHGKDIRVIPNGVEGFDDQRVAGEFQIKGRRYIPRSYFLYVGHRGAVKGFDKVFDVLSKHPDLNLVVVGKPFAPDEMGQIAKLGLAGRVENAGVVTDSELNLLYSNAEFFFFPSFYEGFGIPPIEAMMARCPVVASNRSSVPEVVGDAGLLFDPASDDQLDEAVTLVRKDEVRNSLILRGAERGEGYSWGGVRNAYISIYREYR